MSNTLKYTLIGIGIVALLAGAYIGYRSVQKTKEEKEKAEAEKQLRTIEIEKDEEKE